MTKILFIEDESALQKSFSAVLTQEGYQVLKALNGEVGLALAKKEEPDLILLDLILPRMDGFEVLEGLKKDKATKDIPVIVLTNLSEVENIGKVISKGVHSYLVKTDYTLSEVGQKIKQALGA